MHSFLLAIGLLSVSCAQKWCKHGGYTNVAYMKKVTLSSYHNKSSYPGSNAVNGKLNDITASDWEVSPWLRIDLGKNFKILKIEVFARGGDVGKYKFKYIKHYFFYQFLLKNSISSSIYMYLICPPFSLALNLLLPPKTHWGFLKTHYFLELKFTFYW